MEIITFSSRERLERGLWNFGNSYTREITLYVTLIFGFGVFEEKKKLPIGRPMANRSDIAREHRAECGSGYGVGDVC